MFGFDVQADLTLRTSLIKTSQFSFPGPIPTSSRDYSPNSILSLLRASFQAYFPNLIQYFPRALFQSCRSNFLIQQEIDY